MIYEQTVYQKTLYYVLLNDRSFISTQYTMVRYYVPYYDTSVATVTQTDHTDLLNTDRPHRLTVANLHQYQHQSSEPTQARTSIGTCTTTTNTVVNRQHHQHGDD